MTKTTRGLKRTTTTPIPLATVRVPVKRIGRDKSRWYCERCGQKRRACVCDESPDPASTLRESSN